MTTVALSCADCGHLIQPGEEFEIIRNGNRPDIIHKNGCGCKEGPSENR